MARGDAAVILRFPRKGYREKIWDHCAGAVIVSEAGGVMTDAAGMCPALQFFINHVNATCFSTSGKCVSLRTAIHG